MSNQEPSKAGAEETKVLTTAVGNAELFANTTDTQKLQALYEKQGSAKEN